MANQHLKAKTKTISPKKEKPARLIHDSKLERLNIVKIAENIEEDIVSPMVSRGRFLSSEINNNIDFRLKPITAEPSFDDEVIQNQIM